MHNEGEIHRAIGRLESKVDALRAQQGDIADLKDRVTKLETWRWMILGGAGAVTFLLNALARVAPYFIR